jgi:hypothetical protein
MRMLVADAVLLLVLVLRCANSSSAPEGAVHGFQ